jgi:hypothetical protein
MKMKDEGLCRSCLKPFAGRSIGRHLTACQAKKQRDREDAKGKKGTLVYHLKIWGYTPYWLHIEMQATAKLADLDKFLRRIWLECCGHLSEFTINGIRYSAADDGGDWWGIESKSLNVQLKQVLRVKDTFDYEYDFGSTTPLAGQVYAQREGFLKAKVRILARNTPPKFDCTGCSAEATQICVECGEFYCDRCLPEHECGEDMTLPVVNSPRMGVCGYAGEGDFDDFKIVEH